MMKNAIILLFFCCFSIGNLYSQDSLKTTDNSTIDTALKANEKEISLPKFDVHLVSFDIFSILIGARILVLKNLSLEFSKAVRIMVPTDTYDMTRFGFNYHLPYWHDLSVSSLLFYEQQKNNNSISHYIFFISYIPLSEGYIHFNCRIGSDFVFLSEGLFKHKRFHNLWLAIEAGISVSFP